MSDRRDVLEHRITISDRGWTIRFWIEADIDMGGAGYGDSKIQAIQAVSNAPKSIFEFSDTLAAYLADKVKGTNSVEVCDEHGNGSVFHKDWP